MPSMFRQLLAAVPLATLAACAMPGAAPPPQANADIGRYLVYFEEFSADISPVASKTISDAAARALKAHPRLIRVEARASATGSVLANKKLAETRSQVVSDALQHDGIPPAMIQQDPIGQVSKTDTTVNDRRVDIVLER